MIKLTFLKNILKFFIKIILYINFKIFLFLYDIEHTVNRILGNTILDVQ